MRKPVKNEATGHCEKRIMHRRCRNMSAVFFAMVSVFPKKLFADSIEKLTKKHVNFLLKGIDLIEFVMYNVGGYLCNQSFNGGTKYAVT